MYIILSVIYNSVLLNDFISSVCLSTYRSVILWFYPSVCPFTVLPMWLFFSVCLVRPPFSLQSVCSPIVLSLCRFNSTPVCLTFILPIYRSVLSQLSVYQRIGPPPPPAFPSTFYHSVRVGLCSVLLSVFLLFRLPACLSMKFKRKHNVRVCLLSLPSVWSST